MDKTEVINFLNANPGMQLATIDADGQPHTRGMFLYQADPNGIVFHTGRFKNVYRELVGQSKVEASFYNAETFQQVRVKGVAHEIDDNAYRQKIVATPGREFLKPVVAEHGLESIRVFRIERCRATVWTMPTNMEYPKTEICF